MSRLAESLACLAGLWCAAGVYAQTSVDVYSHIIVQEYAGMLCRHDAALGRLQPACGGLWRPMPCCRLAQGCPSVATPQGSSE